MKLLACVTLAFVSACGSVPPEQAIVTDAAQALGGADRLAAVKTFTLEATGSAPQTGQNRMPYDDQPLWKVSEYTRAVDVANGRMRVQQVREAQFLFAGDLVQRQTQGLDGSLAYNVSADGTAVRASDTTARDRRLELLQHPLTVVRTAMDPAARLTNPRSNGNERVVDIETAAGDMVTLVIDSQTHLPTRVMTRADNANLGDVAVVTTFADYEDVDGLKMPRRLTTTMDTYVQLDLTVTRNRLETATGDLTAPASAASAAAPAAPAMVVTAEPVAKGIWWLAGSGNHRSVVFEFSDHLVLFEAPVNEARTKAVIDKARTLSPKPLTMAIVSHHHFDHSGGLRTAVAEGLTIVTHRDNEAFFTSLLARPHTIVPDALQNHPRAAQFTFVDDQMTLKDAAMEVQLYHLLRNPREGTNLFAYVPAQRLLVQADLYDSTWLRHSWGENVLSNIEQRKLKVDRDVPVHGAIEPFPQMVATIKAKPGTVNATN